MSGTIPRGVYDAVLTSVADVRRQKDGERVRRIIARTVLLGRDVIVWDKAEEPMDRWSEIVDSGEVVRVKVWHSPVGQKAKVLP